MNWSAIEHRWGEYTANAKLQWSKLSIEQIEATLGEHDTLSALLQEAYILSKPAADNQISDWQSRQVAGP